MKPKAEAVPFDEQERILFWPTKPGLLREYLNRKIAHPVVRAVASSIADAAEAAIHRMTQCEPGQPLEFVRDDVPDEDRRELAAALAAGERGIGYMGFAECRICGERLGVFDLHGHGFMWPEHADHYVTRHNVWTPGCERLLAVLRRP